MSRRRRKPEPVPTLREWLRAAGGLRYCADLSQLTRDGLGEWRTCSHRRNGQVIAIRLPSRTKPIVHAPGVARGMRLDDATESAMEAGFFHERPTINELIDALDDDMRHPEAPVDEPTEDERDRERGRSDLSQAALEWLNQQKRASPRKNRRLAA